MLKVLLVMVVLFYYENKFMNWSVVFINTTVDAVPIWEKINLTVQEAAEYSGIGINRIKELSNNENCPFVLWVGNKRLIKRKKFETYLDSQFSI